MREYSGQKNETSKKISMQEPEQNQVENQGKDQLKVLNPLFRTSLENMAVRVVEFSNGGYKIRKIFA